LSKSSHWPGSPRPHIASPGQGRDFPPLLKSQKSSEEALAVGIHEAQIDKAFGAIAKRSAKPWNWLPIQSESVMIHNRHTLVCVPRDGENRFFLIVSAGPGEHERSWEPHEGPLLLTTFNQG
jgi:hypothetical protein